MMSKKNREKLAMGKNIMDNRAKKLKNRKRSLRKNQVAAEDEKMVALVETEQKLQKDKEKLIAKIDSNQAVKAGLDHKIKRLEMEKIDAYKSWVEDLKPNFSHLYHSERNPAERNNIAATFHELVQDARELFGFQ
jgi:hypothetical protein